MLKTLLVISEALITIDIISTEYILRKNLGRELNPLMRNNIIRIVLSALRISLPVLMYYIGNVNDTLKFIATIGYLILIGEYTIVDASNIYHLIKAKKYMKKTRIEDKKWFLEITEKIKQKYPQLSEML